MAHDNDQIPVTESRTEELDRTFPLKDRPEPHKMLDYGKMAKTDWLELEVAKQNEIIALLWLPEGLSERGREACILKAMDQYHSIKPTDAMESMLAIQMISTNAAALDCMGRAMVPGQSLEVRDMLLKHGQKLMSLYTQQMAALDKHRGKGQQRITVEHLTVQGGGQAIVGNVDAGAAASPPEPRRVKVAPPQLTSAPLPSNPLDGLGDPIAAAKASARKTDG